MIEAYHLTAFAGFTEFKIAKGDIGIHFGTIEQATDRYNWKMRRGLPMEAPATIPVLLDLKSPLRLDDLGDWRPSRLINELYDQDIIDASEFAVMRTQKQVRKCLQAKGYDGIVYRNIGEGAGISDAFLDDVRIRKEMAKHVYETPPWKALQAELFEALARLQAARDQAQDSWIAFDPAQIHWKLFSKAA